MSCRGPVNLLVKLLGGLLFALSAISGMAEEIYMTTDEDGVTSFTDFPVPDAQVIAIEPIAADPTQAKASQELIEQQLAVAKSLEDSRLAREKARTERLAALAASQPRTIYYPVERDIGYWGSPGYGFWPGSGPVRPGYRPPGYRPPGFRPPRPPGPSLPDEPGSPDRPGQPPSQSRPMPHDR